MIASEQRVGVGRRLGASAIDGFLILLAAGVIGPLLGGAIGATLLRWAFGAHTEAGAFGGYFGAVAGLFLGGVAAGVVYFLLEGLAGWTVGKRLLGIQIGTEAGAPADRRSLLARSLVKNGGLLLAIVGGVARVPFVWALGRLGLLVIGIGFFFTLGKSRQALHDRVARTAVYRRRDLASGAGTSRVNNPPQLRS